MKRETKAVLGLGAAALLALGLLAGCNGSSATPTPASLAEAYVSSSLSTAYEGALPASTQLILGTLKLEGTPNAVTSAQAKTLLPLWQAISNGVPQNADETNAVLKQIEKTMTSEQVTAIASMQLTSADLGSWMQEQGMNFGRPGGQDGAYPGPGDYSNSGNGQGWPGPGGGGMENLSEEERASLRATMEAGGGGWMGNMSEEERASLRATMEAGGGPPAGRGNRAGSDQALFLTRPLVELLTQRAAEGATPTPW